MSTVFLVLVLYVQRSVSAQRETERIASHNLALVEQSRTLVQNAFHVLRTPLTVALRSRSRGPLTLAGCP